MVLMQLIYLAQVALAVHGTTNSYAAITSLQRYEEPTKKLAKYSDEAGRQLRETRVTQAIGAGALAASLLTSLYLTLTLKGGRALGFVLRTAVALVLVVVLTSARARVASFWAPGDGNTVGGKVPLPKMGSYNEGQRRTEVILQMLDWLAYSWVVVVVVGLFQG